MRLRIERDTVPNDKPQRARRRARNSQAPDPFRRAAETDTTLRKSTPGEAPSSRRGAAAIGAPSSRRGSQAAKRSRDAAGRSAEDALDFDALPSNDQKAGTISERRPKAGPDSSAGRSAVLPGDEVVAPSEGKSPPSRAPLIGALVALLGVGVILLLWRGTRAPEATVTPTSTSVEASAALIPTPVVPTPTAAPEPPPPEVATAAPTATAAEDDASTANDNDKNKKKKKKKKPVTTAPKPAATSAPTAAPTTTTAPAFQFQFE